MPEFTVWLGEEMMQEFKRVLEALLELANTFEGDCDDCPIAANCCYWLHDSIEPPLCDWAIEKGIDMLEGCKTAYNDSNGVYMLTPDGWEYIGESY